MQMSTDKKGAAGILITIFAMLMLSVFIASVSSIVATDAYIATNYLDSTKAFYIAQAGLARARTLLATEWVFNTDHQEYDVPVGDGTYRIDTTYSKSRKTVTITSSGYLPNFTSQRTKRTITETNVPAPTRTNLSLGTGVVASASSSQKGNEPQFSKDATYSTYWQSQTKNGSWLSLTFPAVSDFDKVTFYQKWATITAGNFHIQYLSGSNWVNVTNPVTGGADPITVTFDKVTTTAIRIFVDYVDPAKKTQNPNITEFETYNGPDNLGRGAFAETY